MAASRRRRSSSPPTTTFTAACSTTWISIAATFSTASRSRPRGRRFSTPYCASPRGKRPRASFWATATTNSCPGRSAPPCEVCGHPRCRPVPLGPDLRGPLAPAARFDGIPNECGDIRAAEGLHLADPRRRGDVDFREVGPDHVDARKQQAAPFELWAKPFADFEIARRQFGRRGDPADVHVGARFVRGRNTIDGARHLAVDEDDALVAGAHLGPILLYHEGFAEHGLEQLHQRIEVGVTLADAEHGGTAVAVQRL